MVGFPGRGQDVPLGIAAKVPRSPTGTAGMPYSTHSRAAPCRHRPTQPSRDRVPSGNTSRFHPSSTRCRAVAVALLPPARSIGNVLNTSAVEPARHHTSKK